jgi:PAS domain S-box-containing protein
MTRQDVKRARASDSGTVGLERESSEPEKPLFRTLAEIAPASIFIWDGTQFCFVNPTMETTSGYSSRELLGMNLLELIHPDCREISHEQRLARAQGERVPSRYVTKIIRKDGEVRWLDLANCMIDHEGKPAVLGVGFDITERMQAEQQLREAHDDLESQVEQRTKELKKQQLAALNLAEDAELARNKLARLNQALEESNIELQDSADRLAREQYLFNALVENIPDPIFFKDVEGRFIRANQAMAKHAGVQHPEDMLGKTDADIWAGDLPENTRSDELRIMKTGVPLINKEEQPIEPSGEARWVLVTKMPLRNKASEIVGTFGVARIITERKQLEEKQRQLYKELSAANEALEQSNMELQQFAYIASHDLQTPLRSIAAFAQFLQKDYQGRLDEQADDYINRMVGSVKGMQTMIGDLLAYSRIESRTATFHPVDLNEICDDALGMLRPSIEETDGEVSHDDLPTIAGDRSQLAQLLQNLIANGIKYHGDNPPRVHLSAENDGQVWTIAVRDHGIGIDGKYHEKIFEIFRRLHTEQEYSGTGIGLAVCRRIVYRHGGRIWLESESGKGSTFYFTIPASAPEEIRHENR